ncbi:hypothetical protein EV05_0856 [Prochlorococcus sp. MIT 0601]|nr:hypothetical protein EV05_0856 [Prochlorococcus sp. MIT 0601]
MPLALFLSGGWLYFIAENVFWNLGFLLLGNLFVKIFVSKPH